MPIFSKDDERVYFAHITKTAGSAIYILFLKNGWSLANVQTGLGKKRIGYRIWKEFGIKDIPFEGERHGFKRSLQHAPARIWTKWGPFTSSFAITRHPYSRFNSAMRYFYGLKRRENDYEAVKANKIKELRKEFQANPQAVEPLFQTQSPYVLPDTHVLRYEDDWATGLGELYGLDVEALEKVNVTPGKDGGLTVDEKAWIAEAYAEDFDRFGYDR